MSQTSKPFSEYDQAQIFKKAYNDSGTISVDGFLTGAIGRKVVQAASTTTNPNDTITYTFSESGTTLFVIKVIYTDNTYETMISAERIA